MRASVSMLRIKELHDRIKQQAVELAQLNNSLERQVAEQVVQIERASRLKRFLSPQVADLVLSVADTLKPLESHRREVTVVFCDLRGFTAFAEDHRARRGDDRSAGVSRGARRADP